MQIYLANPRGFCAGVDRAIDIVERAIVLFGAPIYVRHEVVHNKYVVDRLRTIGAVFVDELHEVPDGATVIFSAHGVPRVVQQEAQRRLLNVFDATCPLVTKVHMEITRYAREAREVFLIGHAGHPEVEGTIGQFDATSRRLDLSDPDGRGRGSRRGAQPRASGLRHADHLVGRRHGIHRRGAAGPLPGAQGAGERGHLLRHPKSPGRGQGFDRAAARCWWWWVRNPARIPIGCVKWPARTTKPGYLVDGPEDLHREWFDGVKTVGVTAGASAPEILVQGVIAKLREWGGEVAEELQGRKEHVIFALPKTLREVVKDGGSLSSVGPTG